MKNPKKQTTKDHPSFDLIAISIKIDGKQKKTGRYIGPSKTTKQFTQTIVNTLSEGKTSAGTFELLVNGKKNYRGKLYLEAFRIAKHIDLIASETGFVNAWHKELEGIRKAVSAFKIESPVIVVVKEKKDKLTPDFLEMKYRKCSDSNGNRWVEEGECGLWIKCSRGWFSDCENVN